LRIVLIHEALRIRRGDVISLVGGGGKTTLMFRLADELTTAGWKVVTTMTTKIFVGQMSRAPARLVLQGEGALLAQLSGLLAEHGHVLVAGSTLVEQDKVQGLEPALVDRLAAHPAVDAVLIEADGSRRLPFKAPAAHEPVIPSSATIVVPVAGLDVLGHPLTAEHVHRAGQIAALIGADLGDPVTPAMIAAVLAHPDGGGKAVPASARLVPFLNKVEDEASLVAAREIARQLLHAPGSLRVDSVLIGAAQAADPVREVWGRAAAVVLAAGQAKRFGMLKQVLPWHGAPLVAHVAQQALACRDIHHTVVTTGAEGQQVRAALEPCVTGPHLTIVDVSDWAAGQSRSVRAGLQAARDSAGATLAGVLFLLADQPGVSPELLSALVQRHRETLAPVVAPRHEGQRGNPVLFDRGTFAEFSALTGDSGARSIVRRHEAEIAWVDWPSAEILKDIDTPNDYAAAQSGDWPAP
jgi:molybdenum cofactor cytidylyltransferase